MAGLLFERTYVGMIQKNYYAIDRVHPTAVVK